MERIGVCEFVFNGEKSHVCLQAEWKEQGKTGHFNLQKRENKKWNKVLVPDAMGRADGLRSLWRLWNKTKGPFSFWDLKGAWIEILMFVTQRVGSWRLSFLTASISLWNQQGHPQGRKPERGRGWVSPWEGWRTLWRFHKDREQDMAKEGWRVLHLSHRRSCAVFSGTTQHSELEQELFWKEEEKPNLVRPSVFWCGW